MAERSRVDLLSAVLERGERHRSGREADAGTDRADVVEVVVDALELEQHVRETRSPRSGAEPVRVLDRLRVGDGVRDRAGRAGPLDVGERTSVSWPSAARSRPPVLVEEARVQREDALADHMEAEVAGLDHAGVDGPTATW